MNSGDKSSTGRLLPVASDNQPGFLPRGRGSSRSERDGLAARIPDGHQFVEAHPIKPLSVTDGSRVELLTTKDVASLLRVSCGWVRDHASGRRRPKLQCVKLGKAVRFRLVDVNNFIEKCCGNAA